MDCVLAYDTSSESALFSGPERTVSMIWIPGRVPKEFDNCVNTSGELRTITSIASAVVAPSLLLLPAKS